MTLRIVPVTLELGRWEVAMDRIEPMTRTYKWTPEGLERRRAANRRPEVRAKMAAAARATWQRPEVRAAHNPLAKLSNHQRKVYNKFLRCGIDRDRALAEARRTA